MKMITHTHTNGIRTNNANTSENKNIYINKIYMNNINNYKQFIQHVKLNREIKFNKDEYTVFKPKHKYVPDYTDSL